MATILCVDDDRHVSAILNYALVRENYTVRTAETGQHAIRTIRQAPPDLVILELTLPDMTGFETLARLRAFTGIPVIIVSGRATEDDMLEGYRLGADDYVAKPFSVQTLMCRVRAVLRRCTTYRPLSRPRQEYDLGAARFDPQANEMTGSDGQSVALTPVESRILQLLMLQDGQSLTAEEIVARLHDHAATTSAASIKTHIRHIRRKLSTLRGVPDLIRTERGVGYSIPYRTPEPMPALLTGT